MFFMFLSLSRFRVMSMWVNKVFRLMEKRSLRLSEYCNAVWHVAKCNICASGKVMANLKILG